MLQTQNNSCKLTKNTTCSAQNRTVLCNRWGQVKCS